MLLVRADIADGTQVPVVTAQVLPTLNAIKAALPQGYPIETAGAVEESAKGQASVNAVMPLMVFVMVALTGSGSWRGWSRRLLAVGLAPAPDASGGRLITGCVWPGTSIRLWATVPAQPRQWRYSWLPPECS